MALLALCIAMGIVLISWHLSPPAESPRQQRAAERSHGDEPNQNPLVAFWRWSTHEPVAFYTAALFLATGLLGVLAIVQIRFLVRADKTAQITARAARKSANVAERTLLTTQRPIVAIERFENFATAVNGVVTGWTFRAYIKNTGNSEAINFRNHINLTVREDDLPDDFDYHDVRSDRPRAASVMTAKQENQLLNFVIGIEHALAIHRGERKMFFYGWFEYDDIFKGTVRHRTEFAYKVGFPNDPLQTTFHKPMSFDPYGARYNHIDKGCLYQPDQPPPQEAEALAPGLSSQ